MHITGKNLFLFSDALQLTACWAQYFRFILVHIGETGRHSDGGILSHSSFGQAIEAGMLVIPGAPPFAGNKHTNVEYLFIITFPRYYCTFIPICLCRR